jgi:hypothetical protein
VKAEQNQRFRAYSLISFPSARLVFEQSFPPGIWESLRFTKRYEAYHLDVSRIPPECPTQTLLIAGWVPMSSFDKSQMRKKTKATAKKSERALIYFRG